MSENLRVHEMTYAEIGAMFARIERQLFLWRRVARLYQGFYLRANDMESVRDAWEEAEKADENAADARRK